MGLTRTLRRSVLVNMAGVVKASSILDMAQRDIDLYVGGTASSAAASSLVCAPADSLVSSCVQHVRHQRQGALLYSPGLPVAHARRRSRPRRGQSAQHVVTRARTKLITPPHRRSHPLRLIIKPRAELLASCSCILTKPASEREADLRACPPPTDCSSKAAALSFHEGLTEELRHLYLPHSKARAIRTSVICPAHFKSSMFAGFVSSIPEFFAPSLEVDTVAELVEKTILSGESQVSAPRGAGPLISFALGPSARQGSGCIWHRSHSSQ